MPRRVLPMSVIADISPVVIDDRLARRNAMVLSVAQALAGGNNTVIAATAGIIGTMLASDKGLATLPVSVMVIGIWFGTLPIGWLARNYGRRFALQTGSVVGVLAGLVSCAAVLMGSFELFLVGTFGCGFYAAAHQSYRFRGLRHRQRRLQAEGDLAGAGRRRHGGLHRLEAP